MGFSKEELNQIDKADDLKISPLREDGMTYGTPTWIWNVVVDGNLYVRAYHGKNSRWYQAAIKHKAGCIHTAGCMVKEVSLRPIDGFINGHIDEAYKLKYKMSPYLNDMIGKRAGMSTIKILPRGNDLV